MPLVVICGGGGKTTLCTKFPNFFLDIDEFIWSEKNKGHHCYINTAVKYNNTKLLGSIYKKILTSNKDYLQKEKRIILTHYPINAEWLEMRCLAVIRPYAKLFFNNISKRSDEMKLISINSWKNIKDAIEYKSYYEFEKMMLNIVFDNNKKNKKLKYILFQN